MEESTNAAERISAPGLTKYVASLVEETAKITIGTCAWSFDDWAGTFYPEHFPSPRRLEFYAHHFPGVEVDSTFYHVPAEHVARHWAEVTPPDFLFAAKLSREITHDRKLRHCQDLIEEFVTGIAPLGEKLGCVLVQLPPYFTLEDDERALREFVLRLPPTVRWAIEFRQADWHLPRIVHLLEEHRVCWVWNDVSTLEQQEAAAFEFLPRTTDFVYVRLLGDLEAMHHADARQAHDYRKLIWPREAGLENWIVRVRQTLGEVARIFIFASNQFEGFAPQTAVRIGERLGITLRLPSEERNGPAEPRDEQLELL